MCWSSSFGSVVNIWYALHSYPRREKVIKTYGESLGELLIRSGLSFTAAHGLFQYDPETGSYLRSADKNFKWHVVPQAAASMGGYTVGVLVQTNFGGFLNVDGVAVGEKLGGYPWQKEIECADGSIMMVVATDAPIDARNLERVASAPSWASPRPAASHPTAPATSRSHSDAGKTRCTTLRS